MQVFQQMLILFLLMMVGYICYRIHIINDAGIKCLTSLVVYVGNPAVIFAACLGENKLTLRELLSLGILIIVIYIALVILALFIPKLLFLDKKTGGTYQVMTIFSNIGFMGYPIVAALYGTGAVFYAALFAIPYNILIYTYGIAVLTQDESTDIREFFSLKKIINVGFIACILTLIVYIFHLPVPTVLGSTVTQLGNMTIPLSMIVIGTSLAKMNLLDLFTDMKLNLFSMIKLLIIPIIFMLVISRFITNPVILGVCMVELSTPVGSMVALLAQEYEGDDLLAAKGVTLTTVLSVITIPVVSVICSFLHLI